MDCLQKVPKEITTISYENIINKVSGTCLYLSRYDQNLFTTNVENNYFFNLNTFGFFFSLSFFCYSSMMVLKSVLLSALVVCAYAEMAPNYPEPGTIWKAGQEYEISWCNESFYFHAVTLFLNHFF